MKRRLLVIDEDTFDRLVRKAMRDILAEHRNPPLLGKEEEACSGLESTDLTRTRSEAAGQSSPSRRARDLLADLRAKRKHTSS